MTRTVRIILMASLATVALAPTAQAQEFPFGLEMTLDAAAMPGGKRMPTIEIGENGQADLSLWCKAGRGQFSVAGNTIVFAAGPLDETGCTPQRAQADDDLIATLNAAATWQRRGDFVTFAGTKPLRFRINTN